MITYIPPIFIEYNIKRIFLYRTGDVTRYEFVKSILT